MLERRQQWCPHSGRKRPLPDVHAGRFRV